MQNIFQVLCLTLVVLLARSCVGLRCYSCINCAVGSSIFGSKTADLDKACSHPTDRTPLMSCPSDQEQEYMCGYLEADISFAGGLVRYKTQLRSCMPVDGPSSGLIGRCKAPDGKQLAVIGKLLAVVAPEFDTGLDAKLCLCGTDACDNSSCDNWSLGSLCIPRWGPFVGAGVLLLLVITCCCCCCCRRKQPIQVPVFTTRRHYEGLFQ